MSYDSVERSEFLRFPTEYFRFVVGDTTYRFTGGSRPITLSTGDDDQNGDYLPVAIKCAGIEHARDIQSSRIDITVARDNPVAVLFIDFIPDVIIPVWVYRKHESDDEIITWITGTVRSCDFQQSEGHLIVEPTIAKIARLGLSQKYQPMCQLELYGARCGVDRERYKDILTVTDIDGHVITVSGIPDHGNALYEPSWYQGGYIKTPVGSHRFITEQDGNEFTLLMTASDLEVGDSIEAFAGDDHDYRTCMQKFNPSRVAQVETATLYGLGTITTAGNVNVTITSSEIVGSPLLVLVPVLVGDTTTVVAGKIRAALAANAAVTAFYSVSGTSIQIVLTHIAPLPTVNDSTLNIAIANGTCVGLVAAPVSANTASATDDPVGGNIKNFFGIFTTPGRNPFTQGGLSGAHPSTEPVD